MLYKTFFAGFRQISRLSNEKKQTEKNQKREWNLRKSKKIGIFLSRRKTKKKLTSQENCQRTAKKVLESEKKLYKTFLQVFDNFPDF